MNRRELMQAAIGAVGCAALPDHKPDTYPFGSRYTLVLSNGINPQRHYIDGVEVDSRTFWSGAFALQSTDK